MRSRLLTGVAALAFAITGLLVFASPASAGCGGHHGQHPDLYHSGYVFFKDGTRIRSHPHNDCTIRGLGYPNNDIDVHCWVETGAFWYFVRNTSTGVNGWARADALDFTHPRFPGEVPPCG